MGGQEGEISEGGVQREGRDTGKVFFGTGNHSGGRWPDQETAGKSQCQQ